MVENVIKELSIKDIKTYPGNKNLFCSVDTAWFFRLFTVYTNYNRGLELSYFVDERMESGSGDFSAAGFLAIL